MMFLPLLFLCVILYLSYVKFFKNKNDFWKKRNIKEADNAMWDFMMNSHSLSEVYKKIYDSYPTEPYIGTYIGASPALIIRDLDNIQAVLAKDFQSFFSRGIVVNKEDKLADSLLFMEDYRRWKILRQRLTPIFTSFKLKNMFYIIEKCARDFVEMVEDNQQMKRRPFQAIYTYVTASIGASIFGIDSAHTSTMDSPFLNMAWNSSTPSRKANFMFFIGKTFPRLFKFLKMQSSFSEHEEFFLGVMRNVLKNRRITRQRNGDFIDLCVELQTLGVMQDFQTGYELAATDNLLGAQAYFFFVAGTDTSANTIHFTLIELSNNPEVLKRLHKEIDEVFKDKEILSYDDIEKMKYMDMVVSESMRKYPTIGIIQRKCVKDTVLPVGKLTVEKDTTVIIPTFAIHRDEKYYPNPDLFDPERFAPNKLSQLTNFSYLPFGEGNRICFGLRFAKLQVKSALAWLLRRFTLKEQSLTPKFEKSFFSIRSSEAHYDLIPREDDC